MDYNQIIPLLLKTPKTTPTNAWAIVEKYIEGNIYSNTNIHPKTALIGTDNGTYFLCGEPSKGFIDEFSTFYMERKEERFTIFSPNKLWDEVIESVMTSNTKKMKRNIFSWNAKEFVQEVQSIREAYDIEIHPITKDSIIKSSNLMKRIIKQIGEVQSNT
ncbi:GNAT family N-acetyltransferase [Virgibacillus sp. C22-A2]|uniref:GNAT family N-acetyltransferase n=2 Tax=Virgibacillus tibetensis TaxID=3042313 RepID=A0ABU6KE98_9BACI|nr:GNAT family N-acetyltransferase [Virgibacillus sp. C22-A2]